MPCWVVTTDYISSGMWGVAGRRTGFFCGQGAFKRAGEGTATSTIGLSMGRAFARNHGMPDPSTRKATWRSWQRNWPSAGHGKQPLWAFQVATLPVLHNVIQWGKNSRLACSPKLRQHFLEKLIRSKFLKVENDLEPFSQLADEINGM